MKAIITFHSIDDSGAVLSFPPALFADMINGFLVKGISICSLDDLLLPETDNAVAITFDDGMRSVYESALPVLRAANVPSHLYLTTGYIGSDNRWPTQPQSAPVFEMMDAGQIESCVMGGMHIENHTVSHPDMTCLDEGEWGAELEFSDKKIIELTGSAPGHFAYPYGAYNKQLSALIASRYRSGVTTELKFLGRQHCVSELPRLDSYYLKNMTLCRNLFTPASSIYLSGRQFMRQLRRQ